MTKVCTITCTGGRPELFALCRRYMERQTLKPDLWIVAVDIPDDPLPEVPDYGLAVRIEPFRDRPEWPSQAASVALHRAMQLVPKDHHVLIMEDDDWYSRYHVDLRLDELERGNRELVSGWAIRNYNVPAAFWYKESYTNGAGGCVEADTAIRADAVGPWRDGVLTPRWCDVSWQQMHGYRGSLTHVGIKGIGHGIPGRRPLTSKHNPARIVDWDKDDENLSRLRLWLSEDADNYKQWVKV